MQVYKPFVDVRSPSEASAKRATGGGTDVGANVAGKARVFLPYFGGIPAYFKKCEEVVENGYEGFSFG